MENKLVQIKLQYNLPREIEHDDRFFVVNIVDVGDVKNAELGWIEKEFIESDFLGELPLMFKNPKVEKIREFDTREEYEQYKKNS